MDKASIVGDAVLYVQEMQMKAKKLKAEIAALEASSARTEKHKGSIQKPKIQLAYNHPVSMRILQVNIINCNRSLFYTQILLGKVLLIYYGIKQNHFTFSIGTGYTRIISYNIYSK